ncbi:MAG: hypothetical protein H7X89_00070 [Rhizobiales bacterium]|nr:hypothetical protein [Hyphomicrobiales bacterium]
MRCPVPWYELYISAPQNRISTCCYYGGPTIDLNEVTSNGKEVEAVWGDPKIKAIRKLQSNAADDGENGCSKCHFFQKRPDRTEDTYVNFKAWLAADLSPKQRANLELAKHDFEHGVVETAARPLRYFLLFGFHCNIDCIMCVQIPGRKKQEQELSWDLLKKWWPGFDSALSVDVIGGEPFAIPSAIRFIREFVADESLQPVKLNLFTNGTVVHKHLELLKRKRRLGFSISLDSIGEGYETIRCGSKWERLRENLLTLRTLIDTTHPEWHMGTSALMMKAAVPYLADYARFHVENRISTVFHTLTVSRGIEESVYRDDIISYPLLLRGVPNWRQHFDDAIAIFEAHDRPSETALLIMFRDRCAEGIAQLAGLFVESRDMPLVVAEGAGVLDAQDREFGYNNGAVTRNDAGVFSFPANHIHQAHFLRFAPAEPPTDGILRVRMWWADEAPSLNDTACDITFDEQPNYRLLCWDEGTDQRGRFKELTIMRCDGAASAEFEITLRAARVGLRTVFPTALTAFGTGR